MANFMTGSPKRMLIISVCAFVAALFALISMGYAWFSMMNFTGGSTVSAVGEVDADYSFYVYHDQARIGDPDPEIPNQCASSTDDTCYWLIENTENPQSEPVYIFGGIDEVVPGDKFSFALKVTNVGDVDAYLSLDFLNLTSEGYLLNDNKIQVAFHYQVTRITYFAEGYEGGDEKDSPGITLHEGYFLASNDSQYDLVEGIPLNYSDPYSSTTIVYFDVYFDPAISGVDELGVPVGNSNAFENQTFTISQIALTLVKK
jgi:hypothetical protein